ncbi:hypothetical protein J437_LFUL005876 [Ladona fulva]|uniref:THO complex subunitTHOC2 C-terminal domain-containing protein n=1 Tax=Ladona fulva TaxID=123851 RepID=A0A8K0K7H5_LADFU|nr:hypothetical protein J437_LFUL005876 [Ladona fulva]
MKEALAEQNLAVALCLLMAQQRYCVVYRETENSNLKLVGKLYDQCQDTLVQFGTFLASSLSVEEYTTKLPSIHSMLAEYHIHADVAFFLARPMFTNAINLKFDALRKADPNCKKMTSQQRYQKYVEAAAEIMGPVVESIRPLHPPKVWEDISPQFLVTFWSLTMYDLYVPTESYQKEINKIKNLQAMDKDAAVGGKGKKEQESLDLLILKEIVQKMAGIEAAEEMTSEQLDAMAGGELLKAEEKDSWFLSRSAKSAKNETITQFLQRCIFPRCIFTSTDAVYCAKFVHTIHSLKTANFSTLLCYDRSKKSLFQLFCDITYTVTSCTENEANRYGRFLCAMLETVMKWHGDKSTFEKECANYPGFVTKFRVCNQFSEADDHVGFENYRHVCHKWHYKITKALVVCLDSKDYVQIRNSLIILIKILPHFPVLPKLVQIIEKKIEKVREEEKSQRQDLFILATSYSGLLKAKSSSMIKESDFHQVPEKPSKTQETTVKQEPSGQHATVPKQPTSSEVKQEKEKSSERHSTEKSKEAATKDSKEKKSTSRQADSSGAKSVPSKTSSASTTESKRDSGQTKEKAEKEKSREGYDSKEKASKKEERREESDKERRAKEKKEEKAMREERMYRDDQRFMDRPSKDDRYNVSSSGNMSGGDRYYERGGGGSYGGGGGGGYHHRGEPDDPHDREDISSLSNSSTGSATGGSHRRSSQEPPEVERDLIMASSSKRPKLSEISEKDFTSPDVTDEESGDDVEDLYINTDVSDSESDEDEIAEDDDLVTNVPGHPYVWTAEEQATRERFVFAGDSGMKVQVNEAENILEYFDLFVDDVLCNMIAEQSNIYAKQFLETNPNLKPRSRARKDTMFGEKYKDESITGRIVLDLSDSLLDKGYTIYLDN